jgi:ATP-dependent RNA helicase DBP10
MKNKNTGSKEVDSGGGFTALGLNKCILKGLFSQGFKQPTPIQRKIIPLILNSKDVIAMSRTGSGKTIGFLAPLFHHLSHMTGMHTCLTSIMFYTFLYFF